MMHHTTWNLTLKRMDEIIKEVMAANNLTSIGVNMFPTDKRTPFTVYVHWEGNNCTSGNGATISDAISVALQSMRDEQKRVAMAEVA